MADDRHLPVEAGSPILNWDNSNDLTLTGEGPGNGNNDRWNILGDPSKLKVGTHGIPRFNTGDEVCESVATTQELQDALDWTEHCFAQNGVIIYPNAFGTFGNMGRNILRGPGFVNLDFSVGKSWKLTEVLKLQLRAEVFNILNHANFASPTGSLSSRNMGRFVSTPDIAASNPVIGSGGSRHISWERSSSGSVKQRRCNPREEVC